MPRPKWNGATITTRTQMLVHRDGPTCWLCQHHTPEGTRSIDHVIPYNTRPDLYEQPTNWRLAHLTKAGTPQGCAVTGCTCPGNKGRKATAWTAPPSRTW